MIAKGPGWDHFIDEFLLSLQTFGYELMRSFLKEFLLWCSVLQVAVELVEIMFDFLPVSE